MKLYTHPNEQRILRSEQRSAEQQTLVDEKHLDELPGSLDHESVISASYIGIPGETHVYEVSFTSNEFDIPSICSEWMLGAQEQGWEIVKVYQGHTHYSSPLRFRLGRLPLVGRLFGKDGLKVRIQREPDYGREQSPIVRMPATSQLAEDET